MEECVLRDGDWEERLRWRLGVERRCRMSHNDCICTYKLIFMNPFCVKIFRKKKTTLKGDLPFVKRVLLPLRKSVLTHFSLPTVTVCSSLQRPVK
jgi:hypothetical protein